MRVGVLGSYTTNQFVNLLSVAALRNGLSLDLYQSPYAQYRQEVLDRGSGLYQWDPEIVVLAVHSGELALPNYASSPNEFIDAELAKWHSLWDVLRERSNATVVQHLFAISAGRAFRSPRNHAAWDADLDGPGAERQPRRSSPGKRRGGRL